MVFLLTTVCAGALAILPDRHATVWAVQTDNAGCCPSSVMMRFVLEFIFVRGWGLGLVLRPPQPVFGV